MSPAASTLEPVAPSWATWILAIRPKTLPAAVIPVLVGTALAYSRGLARPLPALAALIGALLIQIGTNLTNDYYDFIRGADTEERVGPIRVTQSGLIAPRAVLAMAMASFALSSVVGIYLILQGGWPILVIGVLSLLCGYAYTGGPIPLAYLGLGDVFVMVFFGLVAVEGTWLVQAGTYSNIALLLGTPVGAISTALLAVNNLRDVETDTRAGKRTLVVRLGVTGGRLQYSALLLAAFLIPIVSWLERTLPATALLCLLALPVGLGPLRRVWGSSGAGLNPALGGTARLLVSYGLLLSLGLAMSGRAP